MSMRKIWAIEEKLSVVLEGFKGRGAREICREHGISDAQYYKWRNEAIEGLKEGLKDKRSKEARDRSPEVERNRLLKLIGEQQLIIDLQKKISQEL